MTDEEYMELALAEAVKGRGHVSPNPLVGAVIVKDGRIIARGYHHEYGGPHAERDALATCSEDPRGATVYVTLEPCCHFGKQPPCTDALIEAGVARVVIGSADPNPLVHGKGKAQLRKAGIEAVEDVLRERCDSINRIFFHYISTGRPFVCMKYAMTTDGKIACHTGDSKWVTGEAARAHVHELRNAYSAILVGIGTVIADDPLLTCRIEGGVDPVRIVCDSQLRAPLDSKLVATAAKVRTIVATCADDAARRGALEQAGCEVIVFDPDARGHVDLGSLMTWLGKEGVDSVLLEGGAQLNWSALEAGVVNQVNAYIAPKLFGGEKAKSPVGGTGFASPGDCVQLRMRKVEQVGDDLLVQSEVIS